LPGIKNGGWSVTDASNMILYQNDEFAGTSDKSGLIIVGDKEITKCPDVLLPGPNSTVHILLFTDYFPEQTSLGYQNLCNGVKSPIDSSLATEKLTQYNFPVELSTGEYEFYICDRVGDGKYLKDVMFGVAIKQHRLICFPGLTSNVSRFIWILFRCLVSHSCW
jgi:hypothetical protein